MAEVLVIDDMIGVQHAVRTILRLAGHTVTVAGDGASGLAQIRQRHFDLVITDMLMPDVDGMEVLIRLAEMPTRPPVIAMSGGGAGITAEAVLARARLQADAFLQKPFDKAELLEAVEKLLNRAA